MMFLNLGLILIGIGILGLFFSIICNIDMSTSVCGTLLCLGMIITLCWTFDRDINPTAMDVYQGKTTLEITYKDRVAIDSVVVFKERR